MHEKPHRHEKTFQPQTFSSLNSRFFTSLMLWVRAGGDAGETTSVRFKLEEMWAEERGIRLFYWVAKEVF